MGFTCSTTDTTKGCGVTTHIRGRKDTHTKGFPLMDHIPPPSGEGGIPKGHSMRLIKLLIYLEAKLSTLVQLLQWEKPGIKS